MLNSRLRDEWSVALEVEEMRTKIGEVREEIREKRAQADREPAERRQKAIELRNEIRKEVEMDFKLEVSDVRKQLRIQKTSELKVNEQIIAKLEKQEKEFLSEIGGLKEEVADLKLQVTATDSEKQLIIGQREKLEEMLRKSKKQSEKAAKDLKRRLEESDDTRNSILAQHTEILNSLKNEISDLKTKLKKEKNDLADCQQSLRTEKELRMKTVEKHRLQNDKLADLQTLLALTLAENDDVYLDSVLGEDRTAIFSKISFLLSKIPIVE